MRVTTFRPDPPHADSLDWSAVCPLDHLVPGRGIAVRLPGIRQIGLFQLDDGTLCAVGDIEPSDRATVARDVAGARPGEPILLAATATFSLIDGRCLTDPAVRVPIYDVRVDAGMVEIAIPVPADRGGTVSARPDVAMTRHSAA